VGDGGREGGRESGRQSALIERERERERERGATLEIPITHVSDAVSKLNLLSGAGGHLEERIVCPDLFDEFPLLHEVGELGGCIGEGFQTDLALQGEERWRRGRI
jgi:hypothetical protein